MTTVVVTMTSLCSGGGHARIGVTGAKTATYNVSTDILSDPISDEDAEAFVKIIGKMAKSGRTNAQTVALLQAGVTITV